MLVPANRTGLIWPKSSSLFLLTSPGHNSNNYHPSINKISSTSYWITGHLSQHWSVVCHWQSEKWPQCVTFQGMAYRSQGKVNFRLWHSDLSKPASQIESRVGKVLGAHEKNPDFYSDSLLHILPCRKQHMQSSYYSIPLESTSNQWRREGTCGFHTTILAYPYKNVVINFSHGIKDQCYCYILVRFCNK